MFQVLLALISYLKFFVTEGSFYLIKYRKSGNEKYMERKRSELIIFESTETIWERNARTGQGDITRRILETSE